MINLILGSIVGLFLIFNPTHDRIFLILTGIGFIAKSVHIYMLEKTK